MEQCYLNPIIRPELITDGGTLLGEVGMREIISRNSPRNHPVYLVLHLILAVVHKYINLYLTGRIHLDEETRSEITRICWNMLHG